MVANLWTRLQYFAPPGRYARLHHVGAKLLQAGEEGLEPSTSELTARRSAN